VLCWLSGDAPMTGLLSIKDLLQEKVLGQLGIKNELPTTCKELLALSEAALRRPLVVVVQGDRCTEYSLRTGASRRLPAADPGVHDFAGVVCDFAGAAYAFGGVSDWRDPEMRRVLRLDLRAVLAAAPDAEPIGWTQVDTRLPTGRRGAAAVAVEGAIYVLGGRLPVTGQYVRDVERFDPQTATWTVLPQMVHRRAYCTAVAVGEFVYALGGSWTLQIERYSLVEGAGWEPLPVELQVPRRVGCAAVAEGRSLWVFGGRNDDDADAERLAVECVDLESMDNRLNRNWMCSHSNFSTSVVLEKSIIYLLGVDVTRFEPPACCGGGPRYLDAVALAMAAAEDHTLPRADDLAEGCYAAQLVLHPRAGALLGRPHAAEVQRTSPPRELDVIMEIEHPDEPAVIDPAEAAAFGEVRQAIAFGEVQQVGLAAPQIGARGLNPRRVGAAASGHGQFPS